MNITPTLCLTVLANYGDKETLIVNQLGGLFKATDENGKWFNVGFFLRDEYQMCYPFTAEDITSAYIGSTETGTVTID